MVWRKQGFLLLYRVLSNVESRNLDKVNCGPLQATTCGARMDAPPCLHPGMDAKATVGGSQTGKMLRYMPCSQQLSGAFNTGLQLSSGALIRRLCGAPRQ